MGQWIVSSPVYLKYHAEREGEEVLRGEVKLADALVAKLVGHDLSRGELLADLRVLAALDPAHVQLAAPLEVSSPVVEKPE